MPSSCIRSARSRRSRQRGAISSSPRSTASREAEVAVTEFAVREMSGTRAAPNVAPLLSVDGVTLQYKTRQHLVTATYRVGFNVFPADRFVLLGPSGCGKSTLLKGVAGFMAPV